MFPRGKNLARRRGEDTNKGSHRGPAGYGEKERNFRGDWKLIRWKAGERKLMRGSKRPMKEVQKDWILVISDVENKHFNELGRAAVSLFYI